MAKENPFVKKAKKDNPFETKTKPKSIFPKVRKGDKIHCVWNFPGGPGCGRDVEASGKVIKVEDFAITFRTAKGSIAWIPRSGIKEVEKL